MASGFKLFGFKIERDQDPTKVIRSFVPPTQEEGAIESMNRQGVFGDAYGKYIAIDGNETNENALINKYREIAMLPEVDGAIEEIVSDAVVSDDMKQPVSLNLADLEVPENLKQAMHDEFERILQLLQFKTKGHDIFRSWYVDGRLYFHKLIDETNPQEGIHELRRIDPRKIRKIREYQMDRENNISQKADEFYLLQGKYIEYYIYNDKGIDSSQSIVFAGLANAPLQIQGLRITKDAVAHANSGIFDPSGKLMISHLHKAIRPANQQKMMEDAMVIYRITRAPERRIFYVDVGNLPKVRAEQHLADIVNKFRNKLIYNSETGEIKDDKRYMAMIEDYWFPRRGSGGGGRGTEVSTLPGAQNLNAIEDVNYLKEKLYKALNVPVGRIDASAVAFNPTATEVTREELKFAKFISRLRTRFNMLFDDLLKTQLTLKGIMLPEEFEMISDKIQYRYVKDSIFKEIMESEILTNRLNLLGLVQPYIDVFFSTSWVQKNVLRQTDEEIREVEKELETVPPGEPSGVATQVGANVAAATGQMAAMDAQAEMQAQQLDQQAEVDAQQQDHEQEMADKEHVTQKEKTKQAEIGYKKQVHDRAHPKPAPKKAARKEDDESFESLVTKILKETLDDDA